MDKDKVAGLGGSGAATFLRLGWAGAPPKGPVTAPKTPVFPGLIAPSDVLRG